MDSGSSVTDDRSRQNAFPTSAHRSSKGCSGTYERDWGIRYETLAHSGQFRDTFMYSPETSTWNFVLESGQPDGSWKHFARYTVKRK
jgi:hypothetical protein